MGAAADWLRIRVRGDDGLYDGELVARLEDCVVINVLGGEHTFAGTHAFPLRAIASEEPAPHVVILDGPKAWWDTRTRAVSGDDLATLLGRRPPDRLLLVEELGDPDVCWIGFPTLEGDGLSLAEVDADGAPAGTKRRPLADLSRVAWGGGYLTALEERLRPGTTAVDAFAAAVRRFVQSATTGTDLVALQRALAELHLRALDLPDWDSDGDEGQALPPPRSLPQLHYRDVFDPFAAEPDEPVTNSVADDLADTWTDVTAGLSMYEAGHREQACAWWRLMHQVHWGEHTVGALRALYLHGR